MRRADWTLTGSTTWSPSRAMKTLCRHCRTFQDSASIRYDYRRRSPRRRDAPRHRSWSARRAGGRSYRTARNRVGNLPRTARCSWRPARVTACCRSTRPVSLDDCTGLRPHVSLRPAHTGPHRVHDGRALGQILPASAAVIAVHAACGRRRYAIDARDRRPRRFCRRASAWRSAVAVGARVTKRGR
jgi:hypothetical protein